MESAQPSSDTTPPYGTLEIVVDRERGDTISDCFVCVGGVRVARLPVNTIRQEHVFNRESVLVLEMPGIYHAIRYDGDSLEAQRMQLEAKFRSFAGG